ncbi:MAG: MBL fold metallo-hydrolase [Lachnospiraceae bacterium]|nr:MBL fold metallo-hydrolase [Lachnospiraceae bacterium]
MTENIQVFRQNSICIGSGYGKIYIDPFQIEGQPEDAAFIFVTHDHYDHFSPEDIAKVARKNTVLVVPEKMKKSAGKTADMVSRIETVKPGAFYEIDGLKFETVPMYNIMKPFHPKNAGWTGYILCIEDNRIYIAGDIDAIKEAKAVKCDVALIPIGGFYTMDAKTAAGLVNEMRPAVAIPVHYGHLIGKPADGNVFAENVADSVKVEFKIRF